MATLQCQGWGLAEDGGVGGSRETAQADHEVQEIQEEHTRAVHAWHSDFIYLFFCQDA